MRGEKSIPFLFVVNTGIYSKESGLRKLGRIAKQGTRGQLRYIENKCAHSVGNRTGKRAERGKQESARERR